MYINEQGAIPINGALQYVSIRSERKTHPYCSICTEARGMPRFLWF